MIKNKGFKAHSWLILIFSIFFCNLAAGVTHRLHLTINSPQYGLEGITAVYCGKLADYSVVRNNATITATITFNDYSNDYFSGCYNQTAYFTIKLDPTSKSKQNVNNIDNTITFNHGYDSSSSSWFDRLIIDPDIITAVGESNVTSACPNKNKSGEPCHIDRVPNPRRDYEDVYLTIGSSTVQTGQTHKNSVPISATELKFW